jgi:hypothetical protein
MATLQADSIADLVALTLRNLGKMKFTEIATDLQKHLAMKRLMKKNKVGFDSGYGIQFQAMVGHSSAAANVGLYAQDNVNVGDVMKVLNLPWRHTTTNYAFERREIAMNRDPSRIVELLKARRIDGLISLAALMETNFWRKPSSSSDELAPYGVAYWIVKNNTEGFNGGIPSGFSDVAGLSPTTYPRWKNWTAQYTNVTKDDLIRKWRKAATFTDFEPPVDGIPSYDTGNGPGFFTNYDVLGTLEETLESQNDNLGPDIASQDGKVLFRRTPVTWVPVLEDDTDDPVYGIAFKSFRPVFLKGEFLKEDGPAKVAGQHTTFAVHLDCTYNFECRNRRLNFVLGKNTTGAV